jgi:hypothetical protein
MRVRHFVICGLPSSTEFFSHFLTNITIFYTIGCRLWFLVLDFQVVGTVWITKNHRRQPTL